MNLTQIPFHSSTINMKTVFLHIAFTVSLHINLTARANEINCCFECDATKAIAC